MLPVIAVHAKHLKARWVAFFPKPRIKGASASYELDLLPMFGPIIVDVVDTQKQRLRLTAASAAVTAICHERSLTVANTVSRCPSIVVSGIPFIPRLPANPDFLGVGISPFPAAFIRSLGVPLVVLTADGVAPLPVPLVPLTPIFSMAGLAVSKGTALGLGKLCGVLLNTAFRASFHTLTAWLLIVSLMCT